MKPQLAITQLPQLSALGQSCFISILTHFFPPQAILKQIFLDRSTQHHLRGSLGKRNKAVIQSTLSVI